MNCISEKPPTDWSSLNTLKSKSFASVPAFTCNFWPFFCVILLLLCLACSTGKPASSISPKVELNRRSVELGAPLEISYIFSIGPGFGGLKKNLVVFVRFLDPQRIVRFVDDHTPPILTNQWSPGQTYRYTRIIFIPENIPTGQYTIELGFYYSSTGRGERPEMDARKLSDRSYDMGRFVIQNSTNTSRVQYLQGWYEPEYEPGDLSYHWRWTAKEAVLRTPNPGEDAVLYLKAESNRSQFADPQNVILMLNGEVIDQFSMEGSQPILKKYLCNKNKLGTAEMIELKLKIDKTFSPGKNGQSTDNRELGLKVYALYLGKESG